MPIDAETGQVTDSLRADLIAMIVARHQASPRQRQVALGPSNVSHPCMRKMAYGMMAAPRANPEYDPLPSIIGTAVHTWLESACRHANETLGRERWIPESRVQVAEGLSGTSDVYDCDTQTVIDWKTSGYTRFATYKKDPGPVFRLQVQLYGLGFERAGLPVKNVALAFLPRAGQLSRMHLWKALYDRDAALAGLAKRDAVMEMVDELQVEQFPERYAQIPTEPYDCFFCPWFHPRPWSAMQCAGDETSPLATTNGANR